MLTYTNKTHNSHFIFNIMTEKRRSDQICALQKTTDCWKVKPKKSVWMKADNVSCLIEPTIRVSVRTQPEPLMLLSSKANFLLYGLETTQTFSEKNVSSRVKVLFVTYSIIQDIISEM